MFKDKYGPLIEKGICYVLRDCDTYTVYGNQCYPDEPLFIIKSSVDSFDGLIDCNITPEEGYSYCVFYNETNQSFEKGICKSSNMEIISRKPIVQSPPERSEVSANTPLDHEPSKQAATSYGEYTSGDWSDFDSLYEQVRTEAADMLVNPIDVTLFTFWSDGTYRLKFSCETSKEECIALLETGDYEKETIESVKNSDSNHQMRDGCVYHWEREALHHQFLFDSNLVAESTDMMTSLGLQKFPEHIDYIENTAYENHLFDFR